MAIMLGFFLLLTVSCKDKIQFNLDEEKAEILRLHHLQRDYHFQKDSTAFTDLFSANFISVNRGVITFPKKKETLSKYHSYFSTVDFVNWDDVAEPIIRFSEDGKLAYTIVDKIVKVRYPEVTGELVEEETHFAWTTIYKKYDNEWKIDCVTSTETPMEQAKGK
jgi:hypothetical protein